MQAWRRCAAAVLGLVIEPYRDGSSALARSALMFPRAFEYHDPTTLDEVLGLLDEHGDDGKLMAGGQSLLPMMKLRMASPPHVVDLWQLEGFDAIREADGELCIGALATHRALAGSRLLWSDCPLLAKAASSIADPQVRNLGTIGGAVAHADPSADYAPALVALGAAIVIRSRAGERKVAAREFYRGLLETDLDPTEMVTEVRVPVPAAGTGWDYLKLSRRASDFALVNVAALVRVDDAGICVGSEVVVGAVDVVPLRAQRVAAALTGRRLDAVLVAAAARTTELGAEPLSDIHADAAYRREVAPVCVRRALIAAVARAGAGENRP